MKRLEDMDRLELELEIVQREALLIEFDRAKLERGEYSDDAYRNVIHAWQERKQLATRNFEKEFKDTFFEITRRNEPHKVFSDFCECSALAISNQLVLFSEAREKRYLQVINQYNEKERFKLKELLFITIDALEWKMQDFLGPMFTGLGLSNDRNGQYFTPYELCLMMAQMQFQDIEIPDGEFKTLYDPACGGGAMFIAAGEYLKSRGVNYQKKLYIVGQDISTTAAYMTYIQTGLLWFPGIVYIGNTLKMEACDKFYTPMYSRGFWNLKVGEQKYANNI